MLSRDAIRILKYLERHPRTKFNYLRTIFEKTDFEIEIDMLERENYLTGDGESGVFLLPLGKAYLEDRRIDLLRWIVPTVISIIALLISLFGLYIAISNNGPVEVWLLN